MTRILALRLGVTLACLCLLQSGSKGQATSPSQVSPAATALGERYLREVLRSASFPAPDGQGEDTVLVGTSNERSGGWRIVAVGSRSKPTVLWVAPGLPDPYLEMSAPNEIEVEADRQNSYIVTVRGCMQHQCTDGRIGFALYSSQSRRFYVSHVTTSDDGSYNVTYYPKSGIPSAYRRRLDQMMCSDNGISKPSALPIKCPGN
jgi:hypothetical protein